MAKATRKASKAGKATAKNPAPVTSTASNEADIALALELSSTLNLEGEIEWFEKAVHELKSGAITAQGLKLTIMESEKVGQAPSIRSAHAEYFLLADKLRGLAGGENEPLKTLLSMAEASARALKKKGANDKADAVESFEVFAKDIEKVKADKAKGTKRGAGKKTADEKKEAVEAITPKKVTAHEMAIALSLALDSGEAIPQLALENLARALSRRMKALAGKVA